MKRLLAALLVLLLWIPALATDLQIQTQTVPDWHDTRTSATNPPHLRIYASDPFWTSNGIAVPAGNPNGGKVYKDITCSQSGTTVTIPSFPLASTTDASAGTQASRYTFWWYTASGAQISTTPFLADQQVPPSLVSIGGCTPIGTCAEFRDLALYNSPPPPLPTPTYPTTDQVSAMIIANISAAAGAPSSGTYITQLPVGALANEQALSLLATGLMKNTTITGVISIATAGVDYEAGLTFNAPLSRSVNTISLTGTYVNSFNTRSGVVTLLSADVTTALGYTPENLANRNVSYAGLSGGKVANSQMSEVLALGDLTDATDALGTGTTVPKGTFAGITSGQVPMWNGTNFVNSSPGTVLSVAFSTNASFLTVTGSPVTGSGTLTANLTTGLTANQVLATPNGSTGTVSLRALVNGDLPVVDATHGGTGIAFLPAANHFLRVNAGATAYEDTSFVQGTNITISHGSGTVTISAAGAANHNLLSATHPDTTPGTIVRGDLVVGQGSGTATWQRLAIGTAGKAFVSDGTDATWGQVSLTAGVTGILPAANGGTGFNGGSAANGTIPIGNGSGFTLATIAAGSNISIVNSAGGIQISASGVLGVAWHNITDPVAANLSLAMGANTTIFTWGNATGGSVDMYTIRDSASNSGTGHVLLINTAASSAAKPFGFFAQGTTNGIEMSTTGQVTATGTGGITATALASLSANGVVVRTAAGAFTNRTHADAAGITWTNGNGVSGDFSAVWNPTTFVSNVVLWDASQASRTWTINLSGATDPVWTYGNNSVDLTTGVLKQGGVGVVLESRTLTGGNGISAIGDLSANRTVSVDQSFSFTWTGIHTFTPTARTSGVASYFVINIPADTGLTASTESIGFKFVTATRTWATGALTTQEEVFFAAPTYAFAGSSTLTNAATVSISGAPIAGSNATITNSYALWLKGGATKFDGRIYNTPTPVYDLATNVMAVDMLMTHTSVTVPAGDTFSSIRLSDTAGQPNTFTVGVGSLVSGIAIFNRALVGSDSTSALYAGVIQADNAGPGTVKALHVLATGVTGSTGVLTGASFDVAPVTGQGSTFAIQVATSGITNVSRGIIFTTNNATNFDFGIDFIGFASSPGFNTAAIRLPSNVPIVATASNLPVLKFNTSNEVEMGSSLTITSSNPYSSWGGTTSGYYAQFLNASNALTFVRGGVGTAMILDSATNVQIVNSNGNGQQVGFKSKTELTTVAAAATTDTAITLPAAAVILSVSVRVTVAIPTAATFTVTGTTSGTGFNTGTNVSVALNTTDVGTKAGAFYNASSQTVRITPNLTPGTNVGRVRVTIHYYEVTAPTS